MKRLGGSSFVGPDGLTHYQRNKEKYLEKNRRLASRNKKFLVEYKKTHGCLDCGEKDHRVIEFDHLRDKKFNISEMVRCYSTEKMLEEIGKCDVVCANCHRIRTWNRTHESW